jgi:signal transduction histidine kinase
MGDSVATEAMAVDQHEENPEMSEVTEFITMLAHELTTPLASIVAAGGLLAEQLEAQDSESTETRLIHNILRSAQNMERRLMDLMDLGRLRAKTFQLQLEAVDVKPLLAASASSFQPVVQKMSQSLTVDLPNSLPQVMADPQRVDQIVSNLLRNATKFTPRGGKIALRAREVEEGITVEIEDNGPGIVKEAQHRLFKPYYRLERNRRSAGAGLGLAIAKQLVDAHGGSMGVDSDVGRGSIFHFTLPLGTASQGNQVHLEA